MGYLDCSQNKPLASQQYCQNFAKIFMYLPKFCNEINVDTFFLTLPKKSAMIENSINLNSP